MKNLFFTLLILLGSLVGPLVLAQNNTSLSEEVSLMVNDQLGLNVTSEYIDKNSKNCKIEKLTLKQNPLSEIITCDKMENEMIVYYNILHIRNNENLSILDKLSKEIDYKKILL